MGDNHGSALEHDMAAVRTDPVLRFIRELAVRDQSVHLTDRDLLLSFLTTHDEHSFAALVRRHGPMVLRVCVHVLHDEHDAEDAFQATFLVLSRKAASVQKQQSVGSWLFGVAQRVATNLKRGRSRQRIRDSRVSQLKTVDPLAEISVREAQAILYEELNRLPEKYRSPLVLCTLEGMTRDEAAHHLGWPLHRLKNCLEWARKRLRGRLAARGLGLPGALIGSVFCEQAVSAAVPVTLLNSTIKAATTVAAGGAATSVVSAQVAALIEGVMKAMMFTKLKIATVLLIAVGLLSVPSGMIILGSVGGSQQDSERQAAVQPKSKDGTDKVTPESGNTETTRQDLSANLGGMPYPLRRHYDYEDLNPAQGAVPGPIQRLYDFPAKGAVPDTIRRLYDYEDLNRIKGNMPTASKPIRKYEDLRPSQDAPPVVPKPIWKYEDLRPSQDAPPVVPKSIEDLTPANRVPPVVPQLIPRYEDLLHYGIVCIATGFPSYSALGQEQDIARLEEYPQARVSKSKEDQGPDNQTARIVFWRNGRLAGIRPGDKDSAWLSKALSTEDHVFTLYHFRVSPDGKYAAYGMRDVGQPKGDILKVVIRKLENPEDQGVALGVEAYKWCWSPDGQKILVASRHWPDPDKSPPEMNHWIVDVKTKEKTELKLPRGHLVTDWSPDGKWFLTDPSVQFKEVDGKGSKFKSRITLVKNDGSESRSVVRSEDFGQDQFTFSGRFSPDGRMALFILWNAKENPQTQQVFVIDLKGGKARQVSQELNATIAGACWSPDSKQIAYVWRHGQPQAGQEIENFLVITDLEGKNARTVVTEKGDGLYLGALDWQ